MDLEKTVRKYVHDLKGLYVNIIVYGVVSLVSFLVWLSFGGAGFWPIWVFLGFAAAIVLQGLTLGSVKQLEEVFPFLKPEWEEQQIKKLLKNTGFTKATQTQEEKSPTTKKETDKKPVSTAKTAKSSPKKAPNKSKNL